MDDKKIRIFLADDHSLLRNGIVSLLENVPNIYVVGEAATGRELVTKYFESRPDVVITDISMPVLSGLEAAVKIRARDKSAKILFLSVNDSEEFIYKANKIGALGLVNKTIAKGDLIFAIETVFSGRKYFGGNISEAKLAQIMSKYNLKKEVKAAEKIELSYQEIETLKMICEGYQSTEIADKLCLSKRTVEKHRANVMKKFNVKNIALLIRYIYENNILDEN
ncbi:MAG: response regulator transcription factor [Acidobacteriota bacterium]